MTTWTGRPGGQPPDGRPVRGISMMFSSGDNGDEIANTGHRQTDFRPPTPWSPPSAAPPWPCQSERLPLRAGLGHRQVHAGERQVVAVHAGVPVRRRRWHHPLRPARLPEGVVPSALANYFGDGPHRASFPTSPWSVTRHRLPDRPEPDLPGRLDQVQRVPHRRHDPSSPLFAGVMAVADQVDRGSLGFLNPRLYYLAGTAAFRDVNHRRKVTDAVVGRLPERVRRRRRDDHLAAHAQPDRHDLHPQGLRRRHRRGHPERAGVPRVRGSAAVIRPVGRVCPD